MKMNGIKISLHIIR